jgi:hypothetical protein
VDLPEGHLRDSGKDCSLERGACRNEQWTNRRYNHGRDAGAGAKCGEGLFQVLGLDLVAGWLFAGDKSGAHREDLPSAKVEVWQKAAPILDRRSGAPLGSV